MTSPFATEQDLKDFIHHELLNRMAEDQDRMTGQDAAHYTDEDRDDLAAKIAALKQNFSGG